MALLWLHAYWPVADLGRERRGGSLSDPPSFNQPPPFNNPGSATDIYWLHIDRVKISSIPDTNTNNWCTYVHKQLYSYSIIITRQPLKILYLFYKMAAINRSAHKTAHIISAYRRHANIDILTTMRHTGPYICGVQQHDSISTITVWRKTNMKVKDGGYVPEVKMVHFWSSNTMEPASTLYIVIHWQNNMPSRGRMYLKQFRTVLPYSLRQIRSIERSIWRPFLQPLVVTEASGVLNIKADSFDLI